MGVVIQFRVHNGMHCAIVSNYYPESTCVPQLGLWLVLGLVSDRVGMGFRTLSNWNFTSATRRVSGVYAQPMKYEVL